MSRILILLLLSFPQLHAQTLKTVNSSYKTSIRGLSVVNNTIIWVSGSNGTVGRSLDKGKTWHWIAVPGSEKRDFRDIEAFDEHTAVIMAVDEPALILRTEDAGLHWQPVFTDSRKGMFLDAMSFEGSNGYVIGDPIDGRMFLAATNDAGSTWKEIQSSNLSVATGEACFASSGTNIIAGFNGEYMVVTGGTVSRLLTPQHVTPLPMIQGKESTGANSIAVSPTSGRQKRLLLVAGGDFAQPTSSDKNLFYSTDHGATWIRPEQPPKGYKSCVAFITDRCVVSCGTSGVDISVDNGLHWKHISDDSYHVVQKAKKGNLIVLAGANGRITTLKL
jgi:photosystem II stability/assembly factor-like uncharacterized protein